MTDPAISAAVLARIDPQPLERPAPAGLSAEERRRVLHAFIAIIDGLYAHLPQKRAAYGLDPVQLLRLLEQRVEALDDDGFHRAMVEIVTGLRDAHTRYLGPARPAGDVAFLPLLVERWTEIGRERFLVSKLLGVDPARRRAFVEAGLTEGVEVTHWNGVPIAVAVTNHAEREAGGRPDARRARAVDSLTLRPLRYGLPPDEAWVNLSFRREDGTDGEVRLTWALARGRDRPRAMAAESQARLAYGGDPAAEATRRAKKLLFAPEAWSRDRSARPKALAVPAALAPMARAASEEQFQDAVTARTVQTASGSFGYLRLWSFDVDDDDAYVATVIDLLAGLPRTGLILDLRGNPGGLIWAAERLLQLFSPEPVSPVAFSIFASDLTRAMAAAPQGRRQFQAWRPSLDAALGTGGQYSRAVPLTPPERCRDIGQIHPGPFVAVVDARTYSAGDLFAAGFVDHRIGTLVSVDEATGAGGANVWTARDLYAALAATPLSLPPLPAGVTFTVSFRRATRVGGSEGEIEDVGVRGQFRRPLTRRDLAEGNRDLLDSCGRLLAAEPRTDLEAQAAAGAVDIRTLNLDRIEVYLDGRPAGPPQDADRQGESRLRVPIGLCSAIEVRGFTGEIIRQRRLVVPG